MYRLRLTLLAPLACTLLLTATAGAQQKPLSLDVIYDPATRVVFSGRPATGLIWQDDSHFLWPADGPFGGVTWMRHDAATGASERFIDTEKMAAALARLPGVSAEQGRQLAADRANTMDPQKTGMLLTIGDDLYYYRFGGDAVTRLTSTEGEEHEATFSPDGRLVAFVRGYNLYAVSLADQRERALTTDGHAQLLNGVLDWVYEEEIYGRGVKRGYWWSPDSTRLAFLQLNQQGVPTYTTLDDIPYHPVVDTWNYPKAGDTNPTARLGIVSVAGDAPRYAPMDEYSGKEILIVGVGWSSDGGRVIYQVQDREQTWLDLNASAPDLAHSTRLVRETTKAWVNPKDGESPTWLQDGSFLWWSEHTGFKHLYHYKADGTLIGAVTSGNWEARTLEGVDEKNGWVYFSGTERSPIGSDAYRIRLDGSRLTRLTTREGTHRATFSPGFSYYLDSWSEVTTPTQLRLHRADGTEVRVLDANMVSALGEYRLSKPEFVQVTTRDGFVMEAMMIKPPDFDPGRRYPVYEFTYSGPHNQQVLNAWGGSQYMYHQFLAQQGIIVWICDNRTASGKGIESAWPAYKNFGESELRDLEDGVAWLKKQPYVDGSRVMLHGWSYGGYMTTYAMTHSTTWSAGIAGGSVTDWRSYDSVYTERYMLTPENNPDGYRKSSPRFAASQLQGRLLLIHGTIDDNVHMQQTLQFVNELQKAGKLFELMLYPKTRHGVTDPMLNKHLRTMMFRFIQSSILTREAAVPVGSRN